MRGGPGTHAAVATPLVELVSGPDRGLLQLLDTGTGLRITPDRGLPLLLEPLLPGFPRLGGDHVAPVDHQQMLLALDPAVEVGVPGGQGDPRIADLDHEIHLVEVALELLLGFGDVARVPLNRGGTHGTLSGIKNEEWESNKRALISHII